MKVFISWSGEVSHEIAEGLAEWLPSVLQSVKPFLSSYDIQKGARWFDEIGAQLSETNFGILCLTPSNLSAPWILFEAGALSKQVDRARVAPLLFGLTIGDLTPPLSNFNAVLATEQEIEKLLKSINAGLVAGRLEEGQLSRAFQKWWPDLSERIGRTMKKLSPEKEVQSAPKRSLEDMVEELLGLTRAIAAHQGKAGGKKTTFDYLTGALSEFADGERQTDFSNISELLEDDDARRTARKVIRALTSKDLRGSNVGVFPPGSLPQSPRPPQPPTPPQPPAPPQPPIPPKPPGAPK